MSNFNISCQSCQILIYHVISHHKFKPDIENTYITTILEHKVIQQVVWRSDSISMNKSCGKNNLNQSTLTSANVTELYFPNFTD
jgi:hypothetical protein